MAFVNVDFGACASRLTSDSASARKSRPKKELPPLSKPEQVRRKALAKKYQHGDSLTKKQLRTIPDKKLKSTMKRLDKNARQATDQAMTAELMLTEQSGFIRTEGAEKTYSLRQQDLVGKIDTQNSDKIFNLSLDLGPYSLDYSRNGSHVVLGGRKGHVAMLEWGSFKLQSEIFVKETIRDVKYLHNHTMAAVAQKKYIYIYDNKGIEVHCLRNHVEPTCLDFLPYHFLLVSVGKSGFLKYQDTSTGSIVAELRTKKGPTDVMTHNPANAVVHVGHQRGEVSLWTPNMSSAVATVLCHRGPVRAISVANDGNTMVTSGAEGRVAIWDLRTFKRRREIQLFAAPTSIDISHSGLIGFGINGAVQISNKGKELYMAHQVLGAQVEQIKFCPFQDVCAIGHSNGFSSIVVPGAGEPNFDAFEANPFETRIQRRETEVKKLLDKIQPDMITMERNVISTVRSQPRAKSDKQDDSAKAERTSSLSEYLR